MGWETKRASGSPYDGGRCAHEARTQTQTQCNPSPRPRSAHATTPTRTGSQTLPSALALLRDGESATRLAPDGLAAILLQCGHARRLARPLCVRGHRRLIHAMTCPTLPSGRATDTASAIFFTASLSFPARGAALSPAQTVPRPSHHLSSAVDSAAVVKLPAQPLIFAAFAQLKSGSP